MLGGTVNNRNFLKYFQILYNPEHWDTKSQCEDKLQSKNSGLFSFQKLSFAKNLF